MALASVSHAKMVSLLLIAAFPWAPVVTGLDVVVPEIELLCEGTPQVGSVDFGLIVHGNTIIVQHQTAAVGNMARGVLFDHSDLQGLSAISVGLDMTGFFGIGTIAGVPLAVDGFTLVNCGKVTADFCYQGICVKGGTEVTCTSSAHGEIGLNPPGFAQTALHWESAGKSVYPCKTKLAEDSLTGVVHKVDVATDKAAKIARACANWQVEPDLAAGQSETECPVQTAFVDDLLAAATDKAAKIARACANWQVEPDLAAGQSETECPVQTAFVDDLLAAVVTALAECLSAGFEDTEGTIVTSSCISGNIQPIVEALQEPI